jgi:CBS domain containing-hemolysin-like protein
MGLEITIICLLLIAMTFLATVDMAFTQLSDVGLRRLTSETGEHKNTRLTNFLKQILANRPRFRFTLSAIIQILLIIFSVIVTLFSLRWVTDTHRYLLLVSLSACLLLAGAFRQAIPRFITFRNPERILLWTLPVVQPFYRLFSFIADPFNRWLERVREDQHLSDASNKEKLEDDDGGSDIQALIDVGEQEGILEEDESELIHSIIEFGDTTVKEVMTPRTDIAALPVTASVKEARDAMIEWKCSRLPVYREQIDDIVGLLFMRDLIQCWAEGKEDQNIKPLLRPVFFVPETKLVDELLEEMQKAHVQLAMVVDEYGGVAGLVTVEDILEEIVGEIEDEDTAREEIIEIIEGDEGYYDVIGSTEIGKIERLFNMEIEADDFTTIAGLVISESGYVPRVGEHLSFRGIDVEVLKADEKKINLLRLRKVQTNGREELSESEK